MSLDFYSIVLILHSRTHRHTYDSQLISFVFSPSPPLVHRPQIIEM